ncbi:hypothetical protein [Rugosimonospora africana]|nr:hypothetical protein [Rugosimonospora africana]
MQRRGLYAQLWTRQSGGFLGTTVDHDGVQAYVPPDDPSMDR